MSLLRSSVISKTLLLVQENSALPTIFCPKICGWLSITIEQGGNDRIFNAVKLKTLNGKVLFGGGATKKIEGYYLVVRFRVCMSCFYTCFD